MERKADPPSRNLGRPIAGGEANLGHTSSSSSSSNFIPPLDLSQINVVFKRHRPLGTMQNMPRASRVLVSQAESAKNSIPSTLIASSNINKNLPQTIANRETGKLLKAENYQRKDGLVEIRMNHLEESSLTPPSITETVTNVQDSNVCPYGVQQGGDDLLVDQKRENPAACHSPRLSSLVSSSDDLKKDQSSSLDDTGSLTFEKEEDQSGNQVNQNVNNKDLKQHDLPNMEMYGTDGAQMRDELRHKQQQIVDPMTRSTVAGSSCVTTMSVHACPTYQCTHAPLAGQTRSSTQMSSAVESSSGVSAVLLPAGREPMVKDGEGAHHHQLHRGEGLVDKVMPTNANNLQSQVPCTNNLFSNVDKVSTLPSKVEKAPHKKKYDPDVFFRVNGKLYQKLGKIGSGGSSEVHKVITSDCTIYALKKIKLKGRDYPTAYGFCQEIEYLNKLKGKSNIIQLIDYEVTDKTLLQEVMNGCMTVKDGRIKDDQYIYMVLEYGEVDLAHMLSQKWKEVKISSWNMDDNWLRFYWQQMLEAVRTIHEERIVHSDLKPANFLLVRGSLKLIDFGIAKAILSDTTNIQRDAQVGTLNYMSPEAFMWNEQDSSGSTIKCGRPSDIWSLGCILYQMVYGKTPFADYKTFWAKFKVITDRNHEIAYEPGPHPLLIDLMKRCLAWDRNERWRIPQLLQHPFIVPPIPRCLPGSQRYILLFEKIGVYWNDPEVSRLCSELGEVVANLERGAHND